MQHLLAQVLRLGDWRLLLPLILVAALGAVACMSVLTWSPRTLWRQIGRISAFALLTTGVACGAFRFAFAAQFPKLGFDLPIGYASASLAAALAGTALAGAIYVRGRLSARGAMLAGSTLSCGLSCMVFGAMAGLVQPFALAYDLVAVLVTMALGAVLSGFALWEAGNHGRRRPWVAGVPLLAAAIACLTVGSLAAILPFGGWMDAVRDPDSLALSPIVILVSAELLLILVLTFSGSLLDNHAVMQNRREAERLSQLADSTFEGILIHRDGWILDANERLLRILGYDLPALRGTHLRDHIPSSGWDLLTTRMALEYDETLAPLEIDVAAADGATLPVEVLSRAIAYGGGAAQVLAMRDVRERRAAEERIRFLAHHDVLTELPNRLLLNENIQQSIYLSGRHGNQVAILYLDLDGFKLVNDTLGHQSGDLLLRQVADRLRENVRDNDLVARVGGDEFVVVQQDGAPDAAANVANRLIECMRIPFDLHGQRATIGVSLGVAIYPSDGADAVSLLKNADIALYRAKEGGRSRWRRFESGMDLVLRDRHALEQDLRHAVENGGLSLNFQPLYTAGGKLAGFESLVRWTHPERGPISPAQFIPLAEESGLVVPLGSWVLRHACTLAASWPTDGKVAVNLSPMQFLKGDLPAEVATVLADTGLAPERLELEVTEGLLIKDTDQALDTLEKLRALGARIVLDDFGTGYSSLAYLHRFPFDKLKIDQSFTRRIDTESGARAITGAIIAMARSLGLRVTAEGVETAEQMGLLRDMDCDELQGFLLGRPMPETAVQAFLQALRLRADETLFAERPRATRKPPTRRKPVSKSI